MSIPYVFVHGNNRYKQQCNQAYVVIRHAIATQHILQYVVIRIATLHILQYVVIRHAIATQHILQYVVIRHAIATQHIMQYVVIRSNATYHAICDDKHFFDGSMDHHICSCVRKYRRNMS